MRLTIRPPEPFIDRAGNPQLRPGTVTLTDNNQNTTDITNHLTTLEVILDRDRCTATVTLNTELDIEFDAHTTHTTQGQTAAQFLDTITEAQLGQAIRSGSIRSAPAELILEHLKQTAATPPHSTP